MKFWYASSSREIGNELLGRDLTWWNSVFLITCGSTPKSLASTCENEGSLPGQVPSQLSLCKEGAEGVPVGESQISFRKQFPFALTQTTHAQPKPHGAWPPCDINNNPPTNISYIPQWDINLVFYYPALVYSSCASPPIRVETWELTVKNKTNSQRKSYFGLKTRPWAVGSVFGLAASQTGPM